jgi:hypothetical protein
MGRINELLIVHLLLFLLFGISVGRTVTHTEFFEFSFSKRFPHEPAVCASLRAASVQMTTQPTDTRNWLPATPAQVCQHRPQTVGQPGPFIGAQSPGDLRDRFKWIISQFPARQRSQIEADTPRILLGRCPYKVSFFDKNLDGLRSRTAGRYMILSEPGNRSRKSVCA